VQIEMQTAVLPVGLELFRYIPWTAVARQMSQGLSPISTTPGSFAGNGAARTSTMWETRSCASVLFNQNAVSKTVVSDCGPRPAAHEAGALLHCYHPLGRRLRCPAATDQAHADGRFRVSDPTEY